MDLHKPVAPLLSFGTDCILSAVKDFQNMDSFAAGSSVDIGSFETRVQDIGLLVEDNNEVGKLHILEVAYPVLDSSSLCPYTLIANDNLDDSYASVSNEVKNSYLAPLLYNGYYTLCFNWINGERTHKDISTNTRRMSEVTLFLQLKERVFYDRINVDATQ